ncbi:MAG TPA: SusC/RagA family TonB-linked outer membrane protein [Gemmatimonadaceae bacterium]
MSKRARILRHLLPLAFAILLPRSGANAQGSGTTISGRVVDSTAQQPLVGAEVVIVGNGGITLRGARTDGAGRFILSNVPAGEQRLRVRFVGYAPKEQSLTVRDGVNATIDFALMPRSLQLDQVVITGTGGAVQKRAVGNVVESIAATDVLQVAPARTVDQLVGARTPGVIVLPSSGQVGTGAQIRIRGASSLSLSNDPIVYIDGVRMNSDAAQGPVQRGGGGASRINDIDPEDIESIEIIKGPAAATLYGTEASNGVVQIITKRGRSGQAHWDFSSRQGTNWLANPGGRAGMLYGKVPATGNPCTGAGCDTFNSTCGGVACQIVGFDLYNYDIAAGNKPVFQNGQNHGYLASLNGGNDANRYYLSGGYDDDVGVVGWNWDKKFNARANVDVQANDKLRLQGSVGHIRDRARLAQQAIDIDPFSNIVWGTPLTVNTVKRGFGFSPPQEWPTTESHADNDRTTISLTGTFNPFSWFSNRLVTGLDVNSENNWLLYPRQALGSLDPLGVNGLGLKTVARTTQSFLTLDYAGSAKYDFRDLVQLTTSVGLQHYRAETTTIQAQGTTFPAEPITTVTGGSSRTATETYLANATVGMYVQEEAAWKNRLFLVAALRGDDNSTFGKDFKAAYYPKVSGSWVVSEEPWFHVPLMSDLRLRAALGAAGTQPGTFDAQRLYDPSVGYLNNPGLVPGSYGNPELRPERSRELELGFETTVLKGRADISYTHYGRKVTDAIVNVPLPPSVGFPGSQVVNIGRVTGWGDELAVNTRVFQGRRVAWELGTQLATNGSRIDDMGGTPFLTVGGGGQAQNRVGFAIGDFFLYKVRSATLDAGGNVVSATCDGGTGKAGLMQGGADVSCSSAPRVYWGHSQPTWQAGLNTTVTLYRNLRLYARVDGNGGFLQSDTEIRALHNQGSTLGVIQRTDPLLQEYRAIEADAPSTYNAGFLRLRELSATYTVPARFVSRVGASGASVSVAGRNLSMLWTAMQGWNTSRDGEIYVDINNQHVWDPELRAVGQLSNGYQTILPQTASFTTTLRLTF